MSYHEFRFAAIYSSLCVVGILIVSCLCGCDKTPADERWIIGVIQEVEWGTATTDTEQVVILFKNNRTVRFSGVDMDAIPVFQIGQRYKIHYDCLRNIDQIILADGPEYASLDDHIILPDE